MKNVPYDLCSRNGKDALVKNSSKRNDHDILHDTIWTVNVAPYMRLQGIKRGGFHFFYKMDMRFIYYEPQWGKMRRILP